MQALLQGVQATLARGGLLGPRLVRPPALAQNMLVRFLKSGGDLGAHLRHCCVGSNTCRCPQELAAADTAVHRQGCC